MKTFTKLIWMGVAIGVGSVAIAEESKQPVETRVLESIQSMTDNLQNADSLQFSALVTTEDVSTQLQKLQFDTQVKGAIERPNKIFYQKTGHENVSLWFDGRTVTIVDHDKNKYAELTGISSLSELSQKLDDLGAQSPMAGILQDGLSEHIQTQVFKGDYYGEVDLAGTKCHHLALRQDMIDWQLWSSVDESLPQKIVITSKMMTGMPQHQVYFQSLKTNEKIDPSIFAAKVPKGAELVAAPEEQEELATQSAW